MSEPGLFVIDPNGDERWVAYSELDDETIVQLLKGIRPTGGFLYPIEDFKRLPLPPVPFYISPWLPKRGKMCLYAPAKAGKSTLCLQTARCIASGEPLLGMPTNRATVVYVQFELGEEIIQKRIKATKQEYPNVYLGTIFSLKLDRPAGQQYLMHALEAVCPPDNPREMVVILDPWYKAISGDENEGVDIRPVLDYLDTIIEAFGCSVIVIHHAGKELSRRGRGSTVLEDWVDSYVQMKVVSDKGQALQVELTPQFLRHAPLPEHPLKAELRGFEFEPLEANLSVKGQVAIFISATTHEVSPADLFVAEIGSNATVYHALKELIDEGKVVKVGYGKYRWKGG